MRNNIYAYLLFVLFLWSCGNNLGTYSSEEKDSVVVEVEDSNEYVVEDDEEDEGDEMEDDYSITETPNQYPEISEEQQSYRNRYHNYEETPSCEDGVVVYEGRGGFFVIETRRGFTVLETYSGYLCEGDKVRGELNKYNFRYIIKTRNDSEVRVYIDDYMLSGDRALEWLGEHNHLKYDDQEAYDRSKESEW